MNLGKAAHVKLTENKGRGSAYVRILVVDDNGKFQNLILTAKDYQNSLERATKNPSDILTPRSSDKLANWLL